jgi:hypothetical protein
MDINALYNEWLEKATADPDLAAELKAIAGKDDEILDVFTEALNSARQVCAELRRGH